MHPVGWQQREAPHEAISIAGVKGFEVAYCHVHHCEKEGIDVKEVSAHGKVHHNVVHDVQRQGLYADAWFGLLEDVEFYNNTVFNCEWGAVICVEGKGSELKNVSMHHNVIYNNSGSGIYFGKWGIDGPRSNIKIYNNTLVNNGNPRHWSGVTGNIDIRSSNVKNVEVFGNICVDGRRTAYQIATFNNLEKNKNLFEELQINIHDNFVNTWLDRSSEGHEGYAWAYPFKGKNLIVGNPEFINPEIGDYRLQKKSKALKSPLSESYFGALDEDARFKRLKWPYIN